MPRDVKFAPGSFGAWLQGRGIATFHAVPNSYRTMAIRLHRGEVAPNSPMLKRLAEALGEPLETVKAFATAPPMSAKWVMKVETQLANSTSGQYSPRRRGKGTSRKGPHKPAHKAAAKSRRGSGHGSPLTQLLVERSGMPIAALGPKLGISGGTMNRLCAGELAPNHPLLAPLAKAIGVDVKTLTHYMHAPRLSEAGLKSTLGKLAAGRREAVKTTGKAKAAPGTALVHVPREAKSSKPAKRSYNKLRSTDLALREAARGMIATLNVAIMSGAKATPPLPLHELHLVLADYLDAKGVRANVLVDPEFATLFDPR